MPRPCPVVVTLQSSSGTAAQPRPAGTRSGLFEVAIFFCNWNNARKPIHVTEDCQTSNIEGPPPLPVRRHRYDTDDMPAR